MGRIGVCPCSSLEIDDLTELITQKKDHQLTKKTTVFLNFGIEQHILILQGVRGVVPLSCLTTPS